MKKKVIILLAICTLCLSTAACGGSNNGSSSPKEEVKSESGNKIEDKMANEDEEAPEEISTSEASSERDLPESDYSDMGAGSFSIQTPAGDSADGSVPVLFISADDILIQIGYSAEAMDGSHLSYIYIDGMEVAQEQLGEMVQGVIDLQESSLEEGVHTVEVVQYSTDEPGSEITTYKSCQYEVKAK